MLSNHKQSKWLIYHGVRCMRLCVIGLIIYSALSQKLCAENIFNTNNGVVVLSMELDTENYSRIGCMLGTVHRNFQNLVWFGYSIKGPTMLRERLQHPVVSWDQLKGMDLRGGYRHSLSDDTLIGGYMVCDAGPEKCLVNIVGLEIISTQWRISCNGHRLKPVLDHNPDQWGVDSKGAVMLKHDITGFIGGYYRTAPLPNHPRVYTFNYTDHGHDVISDYTSDYISTYSCLRGVKRGIVLGVDWDYNQYHKIGLCYTQDSLNGGRWGLNYQFLLPVRPSGIPFSAPKLGPGPNIKPNLLKLPHYHVGPPIETVLMDWSDSDALRTRAWHEFYTTYRPSKRQYETRINDWSNTWAERLNVAYDLSERQETLRLWAQCDKAERIRLWQWLSVNDALSEKQLPAEVRFMIRDFAFAEPSHSIQPKHLDILYNCFDIVRQDDHKIGDFFWAFCGVNRTVKIQVDLLNAPRWRDIWQEFNYALNGPINLH